MAKRENLEGRTFGDFVTSRYLGGKRYLLICKICGEKRELLATNIKKNIGVTCTSKKKVVIDLTGKTIGDWEVLKYVGHKSYLCRCSCNKLKEVLKANLVNGSSTSCGHRHNTYGDLAGQIFGEWLVVRKEEYKWLCQCSCGKLGLATARDLVTHKTTSCGHGYNEFQDITGKRYGLWEVISYEGNGYYRCKCNCGKQTIQSVRKQDLLRETSTSCGCNKTIKIKQTLLERYGETGPNRVSNPRTNEQILATNSKADMERFIKHLDYIPTSIQLAKELDIGLGSTLKIINSFELQGMLDIISGKSSGELEILNFIKELTNEEVITGDRVILSGKELDIYIPSLKLAIEFNGTYWHSALLKEADYHQNKTIDCAKQGIRLIHIFEYEWLDSDRQVELKDLLKRVITGTSNELYAKDVIIRDIETNKDETISVGAYYNNELIGRMILGKPRLDTPHEYEICETYWKTDTYIKGGTEKLFEHIINNHSIHSIITRVDISKFTGNEYTRLGFKPSDKPISTPNYMWVSTDGKEVHTIIPENNIINKLDYLKIYDSGSLILEWRRW